MSNWSRAYIDQMRKKNFLNLLANYFSLGALSLPYFLLSMNTTHTFPEAHKIQQQPCKTFGMVIYLVGSSSLLQPGFVVPLQRDFLYHSRRKCCLVHTAKYFLHSVGGQLQLVMGHDVSTLLHCELTINNDTISFANTRHQQIYARQERTRTAIRVRACNFNRSP